MTRPDRIQVSGIPAPLRAALARIAKREGKALAVLCREGLELLAQARGEWPPKVTRGDRLEIEPAYPVAHVVRADSIPVGEMFRASVLSKDGPRVVLCKVVEITPTTWADDPIQVVVEHEGQRSTCSGGRMVEPVTEARRILVDALAGMPAEEEG